jgi:hypothetical protein
MSTAMRSTGRILGAYVRSVYDAWELRREFDSVETYIMFVGYPRSGHSLVGALLNAHPSMMISHELDVLKFLQRNAGRNQIFSMIWRRNEEFVKGGYRWADYDYEVPGLRQDRCEVLEVIGDKKGGASALRLVEHPDLIERLRGTVKVPIRIIHVTRNPFDNIVTISTREKRSLADSTAKFRRHCAGVAPTRLRGPAERADYDEVRGFRAESEVKPRYALPFCWATGTREVSRGLRSARFFLRPAGLATNFSGPRTRKPE